MNKYTIQIPTVQFGLISTEIEGTHRDAVEAHNALLEAYKTPETVGLPTAKWNPILVDYLNGKPMHPDNYHAMNEKQQWCIQELKKAFSRMAHKEDIEDNIE